MNRAVIGRAFVLAGILLLALATAVVAPQGTAPQITSIDFPEAIQADGNPVEGLIFFQDPDGDVVKVKIELVEGDREALQLSPGWEFDPGVKGQAEGTIEFQIAAIMGGNFKLRVVLQDEAGNASEPVEFGFMAVGQSQPSQPCTVTVQPGQSIQQAIDQAQEGEVICLPAGIWWENLEIEKSLTLQSTTPQGAILQAQEEKEPVITITGAGDQKIAVVIVGLNVIGAEGADVIEVSGKPRATLQSVALSGGKTGLKIEDTAVVTLVSSRVSGSSEAGLDVGDSAKVGLVNSIVTRNGSGLAVHDSARVTLVHSRVSNNGSGLWVRDSARVTLQNTTISDNGYVGLNVTGSAKATLTNAKISGNESGLDMGWSARVILTNVEVSNNKEEGLGVVREAQVELKGGISIHDNGECGIQVDSEEARVTGKPAEMRGNWIDLCGFAPASIRKPLAPQTDRTQLSVPDDYPTIQEAIDAIAPSGTITLSEGTYQEGFTVWKPLTLKGAGPDRTILQAHGHDLEASILAVARGVRLEGLQVTESSGLSSGGLLILGGGLSSGGLEILGQAELVNLQVLDNYNGLVVKGSARLTLQNTQISGNDWNGLDVQDSATVKLTDSWVSDNGGCGIWRGERSKATISGQDNWVKYNIKDFCNFTPPAGFLRETPPQPLLQEAEVCPTCEFTEPWQAIIAVGPGATVHLHAGEYHPPVVVAKDLTLVGDGPDKTIISHGSIQIGGEAMVKIQDLQVSGLSVKGKVQVILQDLRISGGSLDVRDSARVTLKGSTISENDGNGLWVKDSARVTLQDSTVSKNETVGLGVEDSARVILENSTISENGVAGLWVEDSAQVVVRGSLIAGNGTHDWCQSNCCCNGILVESEAHLEVYDSTIRNNKHWGIGAWLERCGWSSDEFTGEVILGDDNQITGNGKGQVCLPDLCIPEGACE